MEISRTTLEQRCSDETSDLFRDSYASQNFPFKRPQKLNLKKENLLHRFEEVYEADKPPELIQVYLRLKPSDSLNAMYEIRSNKCLVTAMDTATMGHGRRTQHVVKRMYTFSHIFGPDSFQKDVFEIVVKPNLQRLSEGHDYTLLTYGASGSGKTYTLMGTKTAPGLIPRSLEYLFHIVEASQTPLYRPYDNGAEKLTAIQQSQEKTWVEKLRQVSAPARKKYRRMSSNLSTDFSRSTLDLSSRVRYYIWVSFIEIYNDVIYDLLLPSESRSKLYIMSDSSGQEYVKGARQAFVRSGEEAYDVLVAGRHNLRVASTGVNAHSSRSHCIFTITMITETTEGVRISRMRLCDLAGSERANRTNNKGARMAESGAINSSLHVLERCLRMLRRNQRQQDSGGFVPFRQSKLTRLLCSSMSGSCPEAFGLVVTLNPDADCVPESKRVLQVTTVAKDIQVNNTITESTLETRPSNDTSYADENQRLRSEVERLNFEIIQRESECRELRTIIEEKRLESTERTQRLVDEAKQIVREYFTGLMDYQKQQHADEVNQLITENAKLQEQLDAEKVARSIDLEELQELKARLEELDQEKYSDRGTPQPKEDVLMLTDSENDNSTDDAEMPQKDIPHDSARENLHNHLTNYDIDDNIKRESMDDVLVLSVNNVTECIELDADMTNSDIKDSLTKNDDTNYGENNIDIFKDTDKENDKNDTYSIVSSNDKDDSGRSSNSKLEQSAYDKSQQILVDDIGTGSLLDQVTICKSKENSSSGFSNTFLMASTNDDSDKLSERENTKSICDHSRSLEITDAKMVNADFGSLMNEKKTSELYEREDEEAKKSNDSEVEEIEKGLSDYMNNITLDKSHDFELPQCKENKKAMCVQSGIDHKKGYRFEFPQNDENKKDKCSQSGNEDEKGQKFESPQSVENKNDKRSQSGIQDKKVHKLESPENKANKMEKCQSSNEDENSHRFESPQRDENMKVKRFQSDIEDKKDYRFQLSQSKENKDNNLSHARIKDKKEVYANTEIAFEVVETKSKGGAKSLDNRGNYEDAESKNLQIANERLKKMSEKESEMPEKVIETNKESKKNDKSTRKSCDNYDISNVSSKNVKITENFRTGEPSEISSRYTFLNNSLAQFENFENAISKKSPPVKSDVVIDFKESHACKEKKIYFDNLDAVSNNYQEFTSNLNVTSAAIIFGKSTTNDEYIHSKDCSVKKYSYPKINIAEPMDHSFVKPKSVACLKKHGSVDIFDELNSPVRNNEAITEKIKINKSSTKSTVNDEVESNIYEKQSISDIKDISAICKDNKNNTMNFLGNNTTEDFEIIYKDLTTSNISEFDALLSQKKISIKNDKKDMSQKEIKFDTDSDSNRNKTEGDNVESVKYHLRHRTVQNKKEEYDTDSDLNTNETEEDEMKSVRHRNVQNKKEEFDEDSDSNRDEPDEENVKSVKYRLRHRTVQNKKDDMVKAQDRSLKKPTKASLRLRRQKNLDTESEYEDLNKLKDIANLQKEFSDVTLNVPAEKKSLKDDIPFADGSMHEKENNPLITQSCPQKSVTRSRRKLYTPREPLEESLPPGDSGERLNIPRPSYHKGRARRKL